MLPNTPSNYNKEQFRATKLWKDLVVHLQNNVNLKRRRNLMKTYENSFTGSNAVDVLYSFVQSNPDLFPSNAILSRENIVRLCQTFIENNVFVSVNNSQIESIKEQKFEDSSHCLYHFIDNVGKKGCLFNTNIPNSSNENRLKEVHNSVNTDAENNEMHKFSSVLFSSKSSISKQKLLPFTPSRYTGNKENKNGFNQQHEYLTSDSENEFGHSKKSKKKLRRNNSFVGLMLRRSSSDSNLRKHFTSTSSDSEEQQGDVLTRGRLRLSQRLSFRKRALRRSGQSSHNVQSYVIQNPKVKEHRGSQSSSEDSIKAPNTFSVKALKRRMNEIIPDNENNKVKILTNKPRIRKVNNEESSRIRRECVRVRLLQILEMPFVDSLVLSPTMDKKLSNLNENSNSCINGIQFSEVSASFNCCDSWISSALKLLQHMPNGYSILQTLAKFDLVKKKRELYFAIRNYYCSFSRPLIEDCYADIIQAIILLLETAPAEKLLEAIQLFVHLLADIKSIELKNLCAFLYEVTHQTHIRLVQKGNRNAIVINTFCDAIVRVADSTVSTTGLDGKQGFVRYLITNYVKVFTLPSTVAANVRRKIHLIEMGEIDSPTLISDTNFCQTISKEEFEKQAAEETKKQLQYLYKHINEGAEISDKKRKELNKKFKNHHPDVFYSIEKNEYAHMPGSSSKFHGRSSTVHEPNNTIKRTRQSRITAFSSVDQMFPPKRLSVQQSVSRFLSPNSEPLVRKIRKASNEAYL